MPKQAIGLFLLAVILAASMFLITYSFARYQTIALLSVYTLAFAAYWGIYRLSKSLQVFWWLMGLAVLLRLALLPAVPNLSDDVYRFIWDGRLLVQGIDPFAYLPVEIMELGIGAKLTGIDENLLRLLNSPEYFTIYPPVNQAIFALAAWLFPNDVYASTVFIRLWLLMAEVGSLYLIYLLLRQMQLAPHRLLLYALNPLILLELTANLHFEALMIFFLLMSFYLLQKQQLPLSALFFALAVCTKLLPLILLPLYWRRLGKRKALSFYLLTALFSTLMFLPLLSTELIEGLSQSVGLYFQKFEFNASIYYIVREIGFAVKGYNIIGSAGRWLAVSTFVAILLYAVLERKPVLPAAGMWVWLIYLALATTVHPWYVAPLLAFSVFSSYRFPLLWSWLIFFSYAGYSLQGFEEVLPLTLLQYAALAVFIACEIYQRQGRPILPA